MNERTLEVIYCDDIRQEIGNKISLMGVYSSELVVPSFPFQMPRFCVRGSFWADINDPPQSLKMRLTRDDKKEPIVESDDLMEKAPSLEIDTSSKFRFYGLHLALNGYVVTEPCTLRLVAESETGLIKGKGLRILQERRQDASKSIAPVAAENLSG